MSNRTEVKKTHKLSKNQLKKDHFELPPQGVNQLLHVDLLRGEDKTMFFVLSQTFFVDFRREIIDKGLK